MLKDSKLKDIDTELWHCMCMLIITLLALINEYRVVNIITECCSHNAFLFRNSKSTAYFKR
jgi:hypothetical protein